VSVRARLASACRPQNGASRQTARVLVVVGTRPEVIKLAPLVNALESTPGFSPVLCVVGQQGHILAQALGEWGLVPTYRIDIPDDDRRLAAVLAAMLPRLADCIEDSQPDLVVVEGDTTTNLGAALAAFYARVPVAHVEAGLRTGDFSHPFPEEMHRVLVDQIASIRYSPTQGASDNLRAANLDASTIAVVGNTVVDALNEVRSRPWHGRFPLPADKRILLVTAHRRENFGDGMVRICTAIRQLVSTRSDLYVVYVLHPNPAARRPAVRLLAGVPGVLLTEPQPYEHFIQLLGRSFVVLTDSGGIQEEAPYLGVPALVIRDTTERPEAAAGGAARIVGTDVARIVGAVTELLDDPELHAEMARPSSPYGDGHASTRIVSDIANRLGIPVSRPLVGVMADPIEEEPHVDGPFDLLTRVDGPDEPLVADVAI
jgi:UDP-N-acetylglucosamine 2-epimerase (non-hydrolysing)